MSGDCGERWVEIADPDRRDHGVARLRLRSGSVATSGNSERGVLINGVRRGHLLDPLTGCPAPDWGSVTVVASDPVAADCLSTALFVMGPRRGEAWLRGRTGIDAVFAVRDGDEDDIYRDAGPRGPARGVERKPGVPADRAPGDRSVLYRLVDNNEQNLVATVRRMKMRQPNFVKSGLFLILVWVACWMTVPAAAQTPDGDRIDKLEREVAELKAAIAELRAMGLAEDRLAEVERRLELLAEEVEDLKLAEAAPEVEPTDGGEPTVSARRRRRSTTRTTGSRSAATVRPCSSSTTTSRTTAAPAPRSTSSISCAPCSTSVTSSPTAGCSTPRSSSSTPRLRRAARCRWSSPTSTTSTGISSTSAPVSSCCRWAGSTSSTNPPSISVPRGP